MSKKKMRAFTWAMMTALAFVPFLGGCAAGNEDTAQDDAAQQDAAQEELNADEQDRNESEGAITEGVEYGQILSVDGDQVTVVMGDLDHPDDSAELRFTSGEDEITFNMNDVKVVDESGAEVTDPTLEADQVIIMEGSGEGADFTPTSIQIVELDGAGTSADDAEVPESTN